VSPWNLANYLTVLRLVLVPVFLVLLLTDEGQNAGLRLGAAAVFLLAALTDRIDGQIARSRGLITSFGTLADPIADKALIGAALVGLSSLGELAWWVTAVVLVREIGVTLLRFVVIRHGVMPASHGGKLKTVLQSVAISMLVFPTELWMPDWVGTLAWLVVGAALLVTVVTGVDYVVQAVRLRRGSARTAAKRAASTARSSPDA
jgi:CDP-diacylglycerol--glycerol-3-phosphate 3-phosphatidyltransferase